GAAGARGARAELTVAARSAGAEAEAETAARPFAASASEAAAAEVLLLDVGLVPGAVPGAVHARLEDLAAGVFPDALLDHPLDRPVVVVCERGLRSRGAEQLLRAEGWQDVTSHALLEGWQGGRPG
ncbi:MAG TPA: rhodanese-like domain-containing protein, partial [Pseudonocardia sp.]|uniref:rhodanese-like domain-containing protein n=1 Tax=Pseudonocardia sp. TaxID=60912 RepID=UPI002B4B71F8